MGQSVIIALFFAICSYKYSKVPQAEDRKQKSFLCSLDNIQFYLNRKYVDHMDPNLQADFISLAFEDQKNREKMVRVTQHCTGDRIFVCLRRSIRGPAHPQN